MKALLGVIALGAAMIGGAMVGLPTYGVWQQGMEGEAALAKAKQTRQIAQHDAQAKITAAEGEARAEVERAKGNAEANRIVAAGLGGPQGYLEYLYIDALKNHQGAVIYVPTEAGMPILEAGKRP